MCKWSCFIVILFLKSLSGNVLWAQSDKISRQNQKITAESHIEFAYHEPNSSDRISSLTNYKVGVSAGKFDTSSITKIWFDKQGRITKYAETEGDPEIGLTTTNMEHYLYDKRGNVLFRIDSVESMEYEWMLFLSLKKNAKSAEEIKNLKRMEKTLIQKGVNKMRRMAGEKKQFVYDSLGYLIYYTNLEVGYKVVVNYKLDERSRLIELSTLDTNNRSNDDRVSIIHTFNYDEQDRVIKLAQKTTSTSGKTDRFGDEKNNQGEVFFTYDTSGQYQSVISKNSMHADTILYHNIYNKQKERIAAITLQGKDTVTEINYTYNNGLVKTELNSYHYNGKSPTPDSKSLMEYQYYPNKEVKVILHYVFYGEEEGFSDPVLRNIDLFEYTYY